MRLVFCGTPQFAIPTLQQLLAAGHTIELVVTQPDRVRGRNQDPSPPPVKILAGQAGLPVVQPEKIKNNPDFRALLEAIKPDAIIVVAYGRIIPEWMLNLPRWGNINLHASLLPKYRGAAPIQWAVANGETVTGATTMRLDQGLDTGDMLLQRSLSITPDQTAEQLFPLLAEGGAELMRETLNGLEAGTIQPIPQDNAGASLAPILQREDALRLPVAIKRLGPKVRSRMSVHQLRRDTQLVSRLAQAALHEVARTQFVTDSAHVEGFGEITRSRISCNHAKVRKTRQGGDDFLG